MKNPLKIVTAIGVSSLMLSAFAWNKPAPAFSALGSDGKHYTLKNLTASKPVLLMFFSAGCPHNAHGIEDMNRMSAMLKGKVRVAGMVNLDAAQTKQLAAKYHAKVPILSDLSAKTIMGFGASAGLDNALVLANGQIAKSWNGYNQSTIRQFEAELRKSGGPDLKLNLGSLPKDRQSGCAIGMDMK